MEKACQQWAYDHLEISCINKNIEDGFIFINSMSELNPQSYIKIKNGDYAGYELIDTEIAHNKILKIVAVDEFGEMKHITINIHFNNDLVNDSSENATKK